MYFFATGLVKRNVSRQTAAADIQVIAKQLITAHARDYSRHFQMTARPMNEVIVDDFKQTLFLLIAAVILLLLISSSNVASLLPDAAQCVFSRNCAAQRAGGQLRVLDSPAFCGMACSTHEYIFLRTSTSRRKASAPFSSNYCLAPLVFWVSRARRRPSVSR